MIWSLTWAGRVFALTGKTSSSQPALGIKQGTLWALAADGILCSHNGGDGPHVSFQKLRGGESQIQQIQINGRLLVWDINEGMRIVSLD